MFYLLVTENRYPTSSITTTPIRPRSTVSVPVQTDYFSQIVEGNSSISLFFDPGTGNVRVSLYMTWIPSRSSFLFKDRCGVSIFWVLLKPKRDKSQEKLTQKEKFFYDTGNGLRISPTDIYTYKYLQSYYVEFFKGNESLRPDVKHVQSRYTTHRRCYKDDSVRLMWVGLRKVDLHQTRPCRTISPFCFV